MLEFRLINHFTRNYNTIDRSTGRRTVIATSPVFTELVGGVEAR
jgi:hypothetical protein